MSILAVVRQLGHFSRILNQYCYVWIGECVGVDAFHSQTMATLSNTEEQR